MVRSRARWQQWHWVLYPILLMVAMTAWAWSSPAGSSPDEDYHLASIWCAEGPRDGLCRLGPTTQTRMIPDTVATAACYQAQVERNGTCPSQPGTWVQTDRGNFAGDYPNGAYWLMGLLASSSVGVATLSMRVMNIMIYVLGISALLLFSEPRRRGNYLLASLVTLVPHGIFFVASINPSGWAFTSATLLWAATFEYTLANERSRKIGLAVVGLVGFTMALASRADATAYAAVAVLLAWFATASRDRKTAIRAIVVGGLTVIALLWYRGLGQTRLVLTDTTNAPPEPPDGWYRRLVELPGLWSGAFGTWGLGWGATKTPQLTWVVASAIFAIAGFWGLRRCGWRKGVALGAVTVLVVALPLVTLTTHHTFVGDMVQPRYLLPLLVLGIMIALSQDNPQGAELSLPQAGALAIGLALANAAALHVHLRRYLTGVDVPLFNLDAGIEWWWPVGPSPMTVWIIGSLAFLGAAIAVGLSVTASPLPADQPLPSPELSPDPAPEPSSDASA